MLVDTDILIDYLRGSPAAADFLESNVDCLAVSSISVAELYQGVREGDERDALESMFGAIQILDLDAEIARVGGLLRREFGKSHGCGLADCLIAATSQVHQLDFFTLNVKHYPMLTDCRAPYAK